MNMSTEQEPALINNRWTARVREVINKEDKEKNRLVSELCFDGKVVFSLTGICGEKSIRKEVERLNQIAHVPNILPDTHKTVADGKSLKAIAYAVTGSRPL